MNFTGAVHNTFRIRGQTNIRAEMVELENYLA